MMKKVLLLNPILFTPEKGNRKMDSIQDTLLVTVCQGFLNIGWQPTLVADEYYKPLREEDYGFEIVYLPHRFGKIFSPAKMPFPVGLRTYLKKHIDEYELVISSDVFCWYSFFACKYKEKTVIWHELALHNRIMHGCASRIWYGIVGRTRYRNVLIAPRSKNAQHFISKYCNRITDEIYQHPIKADEFHPSETKEKSLISVSQLVERKHVEKIVEKFAAFAEENPDYTLNICGEGDQRAYIESLIEEKGMTGNVKLWGNVPHSELGKMLASSKALLIYTEKDNSILTISEAIASGTPVLTTGVPDNALFVEETNAGIVKDDWTETDLERIVKENDFFRNNCMKNADELTNTRLAERFVQICLSRKR